jgi:hypothetical protein
MLIPDDNQNVEIETWARKKARLEVEIASRKAALKETDLILTQEVKKLPRGVYKRGPICVYIERTDKLHAEVADETGEAA